MKLWHALSDNLTLTLSDMYSDMLSLTIGLRSSLTCYLWHALSDTFSMTPSCRHVLADMLSLERISYNTRKLACIFHHNSVVHISAYIGWQLESCCLAGVYERWSVNSECSSIYRMTAIGLQFQTGVTFPPIFTEPSTQPHPSLFISSMSTISW